VYENLEEEFPTLMTERRAQEAAYWGWVCRVIVLARFRHTRDEPLTTGRGCEAGTFQLLPHSMTARLNFSKPSRISAPQLELPRRVQSQDVYIKPNHLHL
jgi:hypothetical protein